MTMSRRELLRRAGGIGLATWWPQGTGCAGGQAQDSGEQSTGSDATETDGLDDSGSTSTGQEAESSTAAGSTGPGDDGLPHYEYDGDPGPEDLFQHGVASGDPLSDAVILWSRVTGAPEGPVEGFFEVAEDPSFAFRVAADYVEIGPERDYTIKLDVAGLAPGTTYYYRFLCLGRVSPIGRTKTAAAGANERMRVATVSCASLAHGYFHAYRRISERADLDLVVHLGDYIYEYASGEYGDIRPYEPANELLTLHDYRTRYAQYRRDPDLQECHRQHPMVAVWDDHELANNAWRDGADNHDPDTEGPYADRKAAATQAYAEWLPFREGEEGRIYRALAFGDLMALIMLDTRSIGRDMQATTAMDANDPRRQLLGAEQETWLAEQLRSPARWKIIGQQVMMAQLELGGSPLNLDQWDGYAAARERVFAMIRAESPTNCVVLTGDIHSSWAFDLASDPFGSAYDPDSGTGAVAVEFISPSITSPGFPSDTASTWMQSHPHLKWGNLVDHGYVLLDVTHERVQASWWLVDDITSVDGGAERVAAVWMIADGTSHLAPDDTPADPVAQAPDPAP